jgi:hypothetical protein
LDPDEKVLETMSDWIGNANKLIFKDKSAPPPPPSKVGEIHSRILYDISL